MGSSVPLRGPCYALVLSVLPSVPLGLSVPDGRSCNRHIHFLGERAKVEVIWASRKFESNSVAGGAID